ncbi:MAG: AI-2E family transporter [Gemmataceae bacterium]
MNLNLSDVTRWGLNFVALLSAVIALRLGEPIFIPTVIALFLAALLWPATKWLHQSLFVPWSIACLTMVAGLVLLNLLVSAGFAMAGARMMQVLPKPNDVEAQAQLYHSIRSRLAEASPVPLDDNYLPEEASDSRAFAYVKQTLEGPYVTDALLQLGYYIHNWLWQWVLILFLVLFLLLEGRMLSRRLVEVFGPSKVAQSKAVEALADMANQVRTYLVWRTIVNFGLGLVVGVVYYALGLQQPWTWALLTAILCYVPYLGPIAAGIPPLFDAFFSCPSPWYTVGLLIFYVGIVTIEGYVVVPVVMGRSMEMNATTVILACIFWELVWGIPGLFLAMPVMAAIKTICYHVPGWRPWANLMGTSEEDLFLPNQDDEEELDEPLRAGDHPTLRAAGARNMTDEDGEYETGVPKRRAVEG